MRLLSSLLLGTISFTLVPTPTAYAQASPQDESAAAALYLEALELLNQGNTAGGRQLLGEVVKKYPTSSYADRALTKLEAVPATPTPTPQAPITPAVQEAPAAPAPDAHPDDRKMLEAEASTLYLDASELEAQGRYEEARVLLKRLVEEYPTTRYAELAVLELQKIQGKQDISAESITNHTGQTFLLTLTGTELYRGARTVFWYAMLGEYAPIAEWARPIPPVAGGLLAGSRLQAQKVNVPMWVPVIGAYVGQALIGLPAGMTGLLLTENSEDLFAWQILSHVGSTLGAAGGAAVATQMNLKRQVSVLPTTLQMAILPTTYGQDNTPGLMLMGSF